MNALAASSQTNSFIGYPTFFPLVLVSENFYFSDVFCKNCFAPILYSELFHLRLSLT